MDRTKMSTIEKLFHQTIPLFRLIFYIVIIYQIGLLKGIILSFLLHRLYLIIMLKIYKLEPFSAGDMIFLWNKEEEHYNMLVALVMETLNPEEIKNVIIEKGIKKFRKMRSVHEYKFFDWWWKELPVEKVLGEHYNPIEKLDNIKIKSKDDLTKFCNVEVRKKINLSEEMPYKFIIITENKNEREGNNFYFGNIVIFKFEHSFTDGLGLMSLITALSDSYSYKLFPYSNRTHSGDFISKIKFLIFTLIQLPWLIIYPFYRNLIYLKSGETPFKSAKGISGIPLVSISDSYNFNKFAEINKKLKITFNDLMMSVFSSAIKKFCRDKAKNIPDKIIALIPVANRSYPVSSDLIEITNNSSGVACELKLIDDPIKECHNISQEFGRNARNMYLYKFVKEINDFCHLYLPFYLAKFFIRSASRNFDINFSNVPGPRENIFYAGHKLLEIIPFSTPGFTLAFVGIFSYAGKFRTMICFDENLKINPDVITEYLNEELISLNKKFN